MESNNDNDNDLEARCGYRFFRLPCTLPLGHDGNHTIIVCQPGLDADQVAASPAPSATTRRALG